MRFEMVPVLPLGVGMHSRPSVPSTNYAPVSVASDYTGLTRNDPYHAPT
jgi:hypothetical protein